VLDVTGTVVENTILADDAFVAALGKTTVELPATPPVSPGDSYDPGSGKFTPKITIPTTPTLSIDGVPYELAPAKDDPTAFVLKPKAGA